MRNISFKPISIFLLAWAIGSCMGCSTINKAYWDHQVDKLCEKDGGVTIYEKVVISKKDYPGMKLTSTGKPIIPHERQAREIDPFFIRFKSEYIRRDSINITREETLFVRNSDKNIIAKKVMYSRSGGDIPIGFHPSHHSCSDWKKYHEEFESAITVKGD